MPDFSTCPTNEKLNIHRHQTLYDAPHSPTRIREEPNKRVSRIGIIQEHKLILKAVERGVPEDRLARALNVNVEAIRRKRKLLDGICHEAAELLKDKHVPINAFAEIKKMAPLRQMEAAELMVAMNKYTISYARSLYAATPHDQLADATRQEVREGADRRPILPHGTRIGQPRS